MKTQRDQFLEQLFEYAKKDDSIILLSVDMGAPALDQWRTELPNQFYSMGISEQNAINVAAGLRRGGKKVFVYFMAIWVLRCFEQIRYSCAMAGNPITIIGNGVGLGYAPAGPAHEPNEDVAVMRSLLGVEIWSPSSVKSIDFIVKECLNNKKLNYVRLERKTHEYAESLEISQNFSTLNTHTFGDVSSKNTLTICTYGFLTGQSAEAVKNYIDLNPDSFIKLCDFQRIYPLMTGEIQRVMTKIDRLMIVEEQSLSGSFAELLISKMALSRRNIPISMMHLPESYIFDNGTREQLLNTNGLSVGDIQLEINKILEVV